MSWWSLTTVIALLFALPAISSGQVVELRVSTFNIRFGTANDGPNHWDRRKQAVIACIKAFDADILGTQETLAAQRDFLLERLPHYEAVAAGRDDGKEAGEMTAVLYRKDRFELLASGHFWLSESPETPGSKSWDTALTRMATWLRLKDLRSPDARPILVINTHFDHVGAQARLESARLIRKRARELGDDCSVIILGDFNCDEDSAPYKALLASEAGGRLVDVYRRLHPRREPDEATFHAFAGGNTTGSRIDWIIAADDLVPVSARIDRTVYEGQIPSDHHPVNAVLRREGDGSK